MVRFALVAATCLGLTFVGGIGGASPAQAASAVCGTNVVETQYIYFPDISTSTPVASVKLLGGGGCFQSYLYVWSWFKQSHSGWNVGLTVCTSATPVYPVSTAGGSKPSPCANPLLVYNTSTQEFYGPVAYGCGGAIAELVYNNDDKQVGTHEWCGT